MHHAGTGSGAWNGELPATQGELVVQLMDMLDDAKVGKLQTLLLGSFHAMQCSQCDLKKLVPTITKQVMLRRASTVSTCDTHGSKHEGRHIWLPLYIISTVVLLKTDIMP